MAITINGQYATYENVKDTFPVSTALTGTVSAVNNGELIVGSDTAFSTELQTGEWLYIPSITQIRQIKSIASDTELYLYSAFSVAVSGLDASKTPKQTYKSISWKIDSTAGASINGQVFEANNSGTLGFDEVGRTRPDPIIIDSDTTGNKVYLQFQY